MKIWYLYMIRCKNGSLYTGITIDVNRRFYEHQFDLKKGAKYLRGKGPIHLVWQYTVGTKSNAAKMEYQLKRKSKAFKERLIANQSNLYMENWILDINQGLPKKDLDKKGLKKNLEIKPH